MRKLLLLALFLCVHWAARGQATFDYKYWFDGNDSQAQLLTSANEHWQEEIDVSQLDYMLHTFHFQVKDEKGVWSAPYTAYFIKSPNQAEGQLYYWFDSNDKAEQAFSGGNAVDMLDVSKLSDGLHTLHFYYKDNTATNVSSTRSCLFYKLPKAVGLGNYELWVNNDRRTLQRGKYNGQPITFDASALSDGIHLLHVQVGNDAYSSPSTQMFIKIPQTEGIDSLTCMLFVDGELYKQEAVATHNGLLHWEIDAAGMTPGIHKLQALTVTPSGVATGMRETYFYRTMTPQEYASMKCYYSVDGSSHQNEAGVYKNGLFHFDLDLSILADGLHQISFMMITENGITSKASSAFFMKTPLGGNGITRYDYWLNDNEGNAVRTDLSQRVDPLKLMQLLPVTSEPFRSSSFTFEVDKAGVPMLYARNDFHLRTFDAAGRITESSAAFTDYKVSRDLADMEPIQSSQTFDSPRNNVIRWFELKAEEGDSIAFRSSQATSIQVFSPSGKEVYAASGDKSINYDGCHTWEKGTYYVGVHDVSGSQRNLTLDYIHLDKYDVVSQDVRVVGNGGCSTIKFHGNGFNDLFAVDLKDSEGNIIQSFDIGHESAAMTSVSFDFTSAKIGIYDAVFHFTEEDKSIATNIVVEEAKDFEIETNVSYPSSFLRGTSTTYTIQVSNKGNMTAYMVPLELKLTVENVKDIQNVKFDGYLKSLTGLDLLGNYLDAEDIEEIRQIVESSNDLSQFVIYRDSTNGVDNGLAHIFMNLPPNTTHTLTVSIKSTADVHLEAWVSKDWFPISVKGASVRKVKRKNVPFRADLCCWKDRIECVADVAAEFAGFALPPASGCVPSLVLNGLEMGYDVWCSDGNSASERWKNYLKNEGNSLARSLIQSLVECVTQYYGMRLATLRESRKAAAISGNVAEVKRLTAEIVACRTARNGVIADIYKGVTTMILGKDCRKAFKEQKPDCPPNPGGGGGGSSALDSFDPNDIYGYTTESGSKFMTAEVQNMNYRIEFENDPEFATSSAHVVEVKDTLNARYFDLKSYKPTSIKIGDKVITLDGEQRFIKTVDMRPAINAIAQVEGKYDSYKGIVTWTFTSIDPMTMEPTNDVMQGFLPVNYDGISGIGEVAFDIALNKTFADGTAIANRASIVFDENDPILTPTWTNVVDDVKPQSRVKEIVSKCDTLVTIHFEGKDERSGIWKHALYVKYGKGTSWEHVAETDSSAIDFRIYPGMVYAFCTLATDSAGNVEAKDLIAEASLNTCKMGDANSDDVVDALDAVLTINYYLGDKQTYINATAADMNADGKIDALDVVMMQEVYLSTSKKRPIRKRLKTRK